MSGSYVFALRPLPINVAIAAGATTVIVDATDKAVTVPSFEVNDNGGIAANLTVEILDAAGNHYYLGDDSGTTTWNAQAVTARKSYKFSLVYPIPKGSKLRVINSAGTFSVIGTQLPTL